MISLLKYSKRTRTNWGGGRATPNWKESGTSGTGKAHTNFNGNWWSLEKKKKKERGSEKLPFVSTTLSIPEENFVIVIRETTFIYIGAILRSFDVGVRLLCMSGKECDRNLYNIMRENTGQGEESEEIQHDNRICASPFRPPLACSSGRDKWQNISLPQLTAPLSNHIFRHFQIR